MKVTKNEDVMLKTPTSFVKAYFVRFIGKKVIIYSRGEYRTVPPKDVFVSRNGYPRSLEHVTRSRKHVTRPPPRIPLDTQGYQARKEVENAELISDTKKFIGKPLSDANLLALDDFDGRRMMPNTLRCWVEAGGSADRVHVPNTDKYIVDAVTTHGGNGHFGTLGDFLTGTSIRFDTVYADFCGFWATNRGELEELFRRHDVTLANIAVLHVTTDRREGKNSIHNDLRHYAEAHGYGNVLLINEKASPRMNKTSFYLLRSGVRPNFCG